MPSLEQRDGIPVATTTIEGRLGSDSLLPRAPCFELLLSAPDGVTGRATSARMRLDAPRLHQLGREAKLCTSLDDWKAGQYWILERDSDPLFLSSQHQERRTRSKFITLQRLCSSFSVLQLGYELKKNGEQNAERMRRSQ